MSYFALPQADMLNDMVTIRISAIILFIGVVLSTLTAVIPYFASTIQDCY
jgi:hypothetical protein